MNKSNQLSKNFSLIKGLKHAPKLIQVALSKFVTACVSENLSESISLEIFSFVRHFSIFLNRYMLYELIVKRFSGLAVHSKQFFAIHRKLMSRNHLLALI